MLKDKLENKLKLLTLLDEYTFIDRENGVEVIPILYDDKYKPLSAIIYYDGEVRYYINDNANDANNSVEINMKTLSDLQNLVNLLLKD